MLWQLAADVHGDHEKLANCIDPHLPLLLIGDNVNLLDYKTLSGIATKVLSKKEIAKVLLTFASRGASAAKEYADKVFFKNPEKMAVAEVEILKEYKKLAAVMPENSIVLHGNVDWPDLLSEAMGSMHVYKKVIIIDGLKVGLLSGTGYYPFTMDLPGAVSDEQYRKELFSLGSVDVLCTHFPPAISELTWDVQSKRDEGGGKMILEYLEEYQPKLHLFAHVHNPKQSEYQFQNTKCKNVGGFRYHGQIHQIDFSAL